MMNFWTRLLASITAKPKNVSHALARQDTSTPARPEPIGSIGAQVATHENPQPPLQATAAIEVLVVVVEELAPMPIPPVVRGPSVFQRYLAEQGSPSRGELTPRPDTEADPSMSVFQQYKAELAHGEDTSPTPNSGETGSEASDDDNADQDPNVAGLELSMIEETRRQRRIAIDEALRQSFIDPLQAKMLDRLADDLEESGARPDEIEKQLRSKIAMSLAKAPVPTQNKPAPDDDLLADFLESKRIYDARHARRDEENEVHVEQGPTLSM